MTFKHLFKTSLLLLPAASLLAVGCSDDETAGPATPPVSPSEPFMEEDDVLFSCDFQNTSLVRDLVTGYELTGQTYSSDMQSLGFNAENPWAFQLRDGALTTNMFAGTPSAFSPAGTANAWLVTRAITIPDSTCILTWKSESLTPGKQDGLKVFISTTGGTPETDFPATPVWEIAEEESGPTENLDGEWVDHSLSLKEYGGETVYIAFVNQSTDKSLICLDDICVKKPMAYEISDKTAPLVADESIEIKGSIRATDRPITSFTVHYTTADSVVRSETFDNVNIQPGSEFDFAFSEKLTPAEQGRYVSYRLWANVEGCTNVGVTDSVASVSFVPETKAVLEEGTGMWCGWCPLGILAIEHIRATFGERAVCIAVHNKDVLTDADYDSALRFNTFPNGQVNRTGSGLTPMTESYEIAGAGTFFTTMEEALARQAELQPDLTEARYTGSAIEVKGTLRPAVEKPGQRLRVAYVVTEDSVAAEGTQSNYLSPFDYPVFGRFGRGGEMGQSYIVGMKYNEVARVIAPSYDGSADLLPATLVPGTDYALDYTISLEGVPAINPAYCHVAVLIVDDATGHILNADQISVTQ